MMAVSNDLLEAVARHPGLKELKIGGPTLALLPTGFSLLPALIPLTHVLDETIDNPSDPIVSLLTAGSNLDQSNSP